MESEYSPSAQAPQELPPCADDEHIGGLRLLEENESPIETNVSTAPHNVLPPSSFGFVGRSFTLPGSPKNTKEVSNRLLSLSDELFRPLSDIWMPEVVACLISLLCIVGLGVLLRIYDHKPLDTWRF